MSIAGIDLSTFAVDIALVREPDEHLKPPAELHTFALEGFDAFERTRQVGMLLPGRNNSFWDEVVAVGIEEPAGRNPGFQFRVQGAVLSMIPEWMLVEKFMPSEWRKKVGLPGNCTKETVFEWVTEQLGGRPASQDAADAYCIALATQRKMEEQDGERAA